MKVLIAFFVAPALCLSMQSQVGRDTELNKASAAANASASGVPSINHSLSSSISVSGIASVRSLRVSGNSDWRPNEGSKEEVSILENTLSSV